MNILILMENTIKFVRNALKKEGIREIRIMENNSPTLLINPPPQDRKCEGCGKHTSELEPFPKIDEDDRDGILLMKNYRKMSPHIPELDEKIKKLKSPEDWEKLAKENKEEYDNISFYEQLISTVGASWECKDCFRLDDDDFYKIQNERYKKVGREEDDLE